MEPTDGDGPFDDPAYRFEPWWPGTRVLVAVERGEVRVAGPHLAEPLAALPELLVLRDVVALDGVVLDGTLLVLDAEGRPDAELLRERLAHPELRGGSAAFVASDLLYAGGVALAPRPFEERLRRLTELLRETDWCMVARGYVGDGCAVAEALEAMGLAAMSARYLAARYRPGPSGGAWLRLPLSSAAPPGRPPTLALIQRLGL